MEKGMGDYRDGDEKGEIRGGARGEKNALKSTKQYKQSRQNVFHVFSKIH